MFEAHMHVQQADHQGCDQLSRASFYRIVSALIAGGSRLRRAVDYVTGFLVNDCFAVIQQVVNSLNLHGDVRSDIEKDMEIARADLKYGFDWKTRDPTSNCVLHSCLQGLDGSSSSIDQGTIPYYSGCSRLFGFYRRIQVLLY